MLRELVMAIANNQQSNGSHLPNGVDREIIEDFFVDFREAHQHCEHVLIKLEKTPKDQALINNLFRSVHTIKGNLIYVNMREISTLLQRVEDVLEEIRHQRFLYDASLSDVILLAMDVTKMQVQASINQTAPPLNPKRFAAVCKAIGNIASAKPNQQQQCIRDAILLLDPKTKLSTPTSKKITQQKTTSTEISLLKILKKNNIEQDQDFELFRRLAEPQETRSPYWLGRLERMLTVALAMNKAANTPVQPTQLAAAILMHDIGMSFLPLSVLHKTTKLTSVELRMIHSHPRTGYDLLRRMQRWQEAAEMVLHHHERIDGRGYPKGLTALEICTGAKIISIVDTFDARTHERAHITQLKRPFVRAILEINKCAGSQFSEKWVDIFNKVIREKSH
jgi:response regulator RpfG family c-di-GMP phosphodiesterase